MSEQSDHPQPREARPPLFAARLNELAARFRQLLNRNVEIATGPIAGRAALLQITTIPLVLAFGAAIILGDAVWADDNGAAASAAAVVNSVSGGGTTLRSVDVEFPDPGRQFPGGHEAEAINNNCLACHSAGMVLTQPRLSRAEWQNEVDKMRNTYKAPVTAADVPAIVDYLVNLRGRS
jgi:hypothetical protein